MTMHETSGHAMSQEMQECIQNCLTCHSVCMQTIQHCLRIGGKHAAHTHIRLLMDCAEICQTSANFMLRGSELHQWTCATCAEVCKRCDQECREMGDDRWMLACADACKRCTESCRQMAA
jgi:hypothetical protein